MSNFIDLVTQRYNQELEASLLQDAKANPITDKLLVLVDVSGSMEFPATDWHASRLQHAAAIAIELKARANCSIWASSGLDYDQTQKTELMKQEGYLLFRELEFACKNFGGGGIFLEKAIKHISHYEVKPNHLIILTDEQAGSYMPTFGKRVTIMNMDNYIKPY